MKAIHTPLTSEAASRLRVGDQVLLTGELIGMRDAAHRRVVECLERGEEPPVDLRGALIYYVGPAPAKPGRVVGPAGPTTSSRMDAYTPALLEHGVRGMVGKGKRGPEVRDAIARTGAVYFHAVGGAAALIASCIREMAVIAYEDLGTEAIHRLRVENLPLVVANDAHGDDVYERGRERYRVPESRK